MINSTVRSPKISSCTKSGYKDWERLTVFFNGKFSTKDTMYKEIKKHGLFKGTKNESPETIPEERQFPETLNKAFNANFLLMFKKWNWVLTFWTVNGAEKKNLGERTTAEEMDLECGLVADEQEAWCTQGPARWPDFTSSRVRSSKK